MYDIASFSAFNGIKSKVVNAGLASDIALKKQAIEAHSLVYNLNGSKQSAAGYYYYQQCMQCIERVNTLCCEQAMAIQF